MTHPTPLSMRPQATPPAVGPSLWMCIAAVLLAHVALLRVDAPDWRVGASKPTMSLRHIEWVNRADAAAESQATVATPAAAQVTPRAANPASEGTRPPSGAAATAGDSSAANPPGLPAPIERATPSEADAPSGPNAPTDARWLNAATVQLPAQMRVRYRVHSTVKGLPVRGSAELLWRSSGSDYDARMEISMPLGGSRTQRSTGHITSEGLAPARFSERRRSEEAAHFERARGVIVFSANRPEAALQSGAQDRLSVLLQLGALVGSVRPAFSTGSQISIQTASAHDADLWRFAVEGRETLQLPGGQVSALRLSRAPRHEHDQRVDLWLDPAQHHLPVRIRLTAADGSVFDQQWERTE